LRRRKMCGKRKVDSKIKGRIGAASRGRNSESGGEKYKSRKRKKRSGGKRLGTSL